MALPSSPGGSAPLIPAETVTGAEIAAADWTGSPLGPIESWPPSLLATLRLMLACPTPMFLAWGDDLLCFYNDAYRPVLGYRLATALGRPFREVWGSIWQDIGPLVDATLRGESQTLSDLPLDLARDGRSEQSWWSFTYSPAFDDAGRIAGLFCVTGETTAKVLAERSRHEADERLQLALSAGNSIGAWDWDVVADRVTADARFAVLYGLEPARAAVGTPVGEFFKGIHPDDLPAVQAAIDVAMRTGDAFIEEYRLLSPDGNVRWVSAQGRPILDETGRCIRFPGVSYDVTKRRASDLALKAAKEERDFVLALSSQQREMDDPDAIMRFSAGELGRRLGVSRTGFYRVMGPKLLRYVGGWSDGTLDVLTGQMSRQRFGKRFERYRREGRTIVYADSRHDPEGGLEILAGTGVLSGIGVPVLKDGNWLAGLYVNHAAVRAWTGAEIGLVKEVAELTWSAVERAEAVIRLRANLERQGEALQRTTSDLRKESAERASAEGQLRQLQKMEAVGQLTGGIAHDFNNMLAVVIGGLNLLQRRLARGDTDVGKYVDAAMDGATRAAQLTQRLLAFSRQQPLAPEPLDPNRLVAGLGELLGRTLGETVGLETILAAGLWRVKVDPNQLENVIINLAVNARDAMPAGGRLTIETANAHVDADYARDYDLAAGQYVRIAVTDTGVGMDPTVAARAFEPFFTTKPVGKGTGLGLSQVYGFVGQSGGHVRVYSEVGHGTTFKLYFPRHYGEEVAAPSKRAGGGTTHGVPTEIILVVEDEERVRILSVEALRELGYTVLHASSGPEALRVIDEGQDVTLLFTDVVMPGMTGRQLAEEAGRRLPRLKVIYTTGYTRNAVVHNGAIDPGTNFLPKPFGLGQLAEMVREVLDAA